MLDRILSPVVLAVAGFLIAVPAQAQVQLNGDVKLVKTVEENGISVTNLVEPKQVVPGDRLLFMTEYENTTDELVEDFVVNNPLPSAVKLAENGDFEVSVDGGTTFAPLQRLSVVRENGERTAATPDDVTHLRWTLDRLEPGAKGQVQFFAVIR